MWILFAIGALVFQAVTATIDKIAVVKDKTINTLAATFWRQVVFWLWSCFFAVLGVAGSLTLFVRWPIVLLAMLFMASSFFYTYLLKKVELTGFSVVAYLSPFLYLLVDTIILKLHVSAFQTFGILLLTAGGMLFALNPKGGIKKEFTAKVWGIFAYDFLMNGVAYYSFKYYSTTYQLNEVSYFFNIWMVMVAMLAVVVIFHSNRKTVWHTALSHGYLAKVTLSKGLDAVCAYLGFHAIALATVSQVNGMSALFPLILVIVVYASQKIFKFKAGEKFSHGHIILKFVAVVLLCIGGFMAR